MTSILIKYAKYHGLGNDYIVIWAKGPGFELTSDQIRLICHRNYGVGADGILLGPVEAKAADSGLRIFNPDGSEAEKSGNGLRIFSRYMWDMGLVGIEPFTIETLGGVVQAQVLDDGRSVKVEMGAVNFDSTLIPVEGPSREVLNEVMEVGGERLAFCAATVGNPHCVIMREEVSTAEAQRLGPLIELDARFPNRTNVQFMKVLDRENIQIEIWERGAGYTLASGSSSCAAAAVVHRLGLCGPEITVNMPGGQIAVSISEDYRITMSGPVVKVCEGVIADEAFGVTP